MKQSVSELSEWALPTGRNPTGTVYTADMRRACFVILLLGCKELRPMFSEPVVYSKARKHRERFWLVYLAQRQISAV